MSGSGIKRKRGCETNASCCIEQCKHDNHLEGCKNKVSFKISKELLSSSQFTFTSGSSLTTSSGDKLLPEQLNSAGRKDESYKSGRLFDEDNQEHCQSKLNEKPVPIDVKEETCIQTDDLHLILLIESAQLDQAFQLLQGDHSFSQDGLDMALISACEGGCEFLVQNLVDLGANVQYMDTSGNTPLMRCAENGFIDIVRFLLTKKADVNAVNYTGNTALILSIRSSGSTEMVKVLLEQPEININHQNSDGYTALMKSIEVRDIEVMDMLLEQTYKQNIREESNNVSVVNKAFGKIFNKDAKTGLANYKDIAMVKKLLEYGADVKGSSGYLMLTEAVKARNYQLVELLCQHGAALVFQKHPSPLDFALTNGDIDCAKLLIRYGGTLYFEYAFNLAINGKSAEYSKFLTENYPQEITKHLLANKKSLQNLLFTAVRGGNIEMICQILDAGADINRPDIFGVTALVESKNGVVAQFLIHRGANTNQFMNVRFHGIMTPLLLLTARLPNTRATKNIDNSVTTDIVRVLLENQASPNAQDKSGKTALLLAATRKRVDTLLRILLDHNADLCHKDEMGNSALIHAVRKCPLNVSFLLRYSKRRNFINIQNYYGKTALFYAIPKGGIALIKKLLSHGAKVNIKDSKGNTALVEALVNCWNPDVLTTLIKAGSEVNCQNNDGFSPLMLAVRENKRDGLQILLDYGADINAISETDPTRTAISCFTNTGYSRVDLLCRLEYLLDHGASALYISFDVLMNLMFYGYSELFLKIIRCGLLPKETDSYKISQCLGSFKVSMLCSALLAGNVELARYFIDIHFLANSDVTSLMRNQNMRYFLEKMRYEKYQECLDFLDQISSRPLSLFTLAFVAVSSAVGTSPGRENRVSLLPLPQVMKEMLLFKRKQIKLLVKSNLHSRNLTLSWPFDIKRYFDGN